MYWEVSRQWLTSLKRFLVFFWNLIGFRIRHFLDLLDRNESPSFSKTFYSWLPRTVVSLGADPHLPRVSIVITL